MGVNLVCEKDCLKSLELTRRIFFSFLRMRYQYTPKFNGMHNRSFDKVKVLLFGERDKYAFRIRFGTAVAT